MKGNLYRPTAGFRGWSVDNEGDLRWQEDFRVFSIFELGDNVS